MKQRFREFDNRRGGRGSSRPPWGEPGFRLFRQNSILPRIRPRVNETWDIAIRKRKFIRKVISIGSIRHFFAKKNPRRTLFDLCRLSTPVLTRSTSKLPVEIFSNLSRDLSHLP